MNQTSGSVTKLRASDGLHQGTFTVANAPLAAAFDGNSIWVTSSLGVTRLRASDGFNLGTFPAGQQPSGLAFDGANIWVANEADATVSKL